MILETRQLQKGEVIPYDLLLLADETLEAIDRYINDSEIYVLEREDRVVAIYVLQKISQESMEIKNIAVVERLQGRGVGKLLLREAISRVEKRGVKEIIIGTGDGSIQQLNLYQRVGFEIFDIRKGFFIHNYPAPIYENGVRLKDMIMLRKELG